MARAAPSRTKNEKISQKRRGQREVSFDFIKSNFFRVIAVEGAFGGISPQGRSIHLAVYSERRPIPTKTIHPLQEGGLVGEELKKKRQSRTGFIREVEADLVFDLSTAQAIHQWLGDKIKELSGSLAERGEMPTSDEAEKESDK